MTNATLEVKKPKRKISYYLLNFLAILFAVSITVSDVKFINEVMFGLMVLVIVKMLYEKFKFQQVKNLYEIETHFDKLNAAFFACIGIGMIVVSFMNSDFMVKLNLDWINYLVFGLFFIFNAFTNNKSLKLISKNSGVIELEDYSLLLNSDVKQIELFKNKMIVSKSKNENYEFRGLIIAEQDQTKLSNWIESNLPDTQIEINIVLKQ